MSATSGGAFRGYRNRLGLERSPYLLQHANNPVDWYAWGNEAFEKAKAENKLIFLSVGYSTCHWCHVMERESFESEEVGSLLNSSFVSIKVDREERPDIDHIYMTFIQATSGGGGWPMSVWLTPDLKPIVGGTYFPPDDRYYGRPGFKSILTKISAAWRNSPSDVLAQGQAILDALSESTKPTEVSGSSIPSCSSVVDKCFATLSKSYDRKMGGFGNAPKFPQPVNFNFMLNVYDSCCREACKSNAKPSERGQQAVDMTLHTLRMMARGGMHDHIGQGFHRYSTDEDWHVPHFEKMLYDQAQLVVVYLDAFQITKEELFSEVARDILSYVSRDLSDKSGGFYSAEDADSLPAFGDTEKREGAFCVWTCDELRELLVSPVEGASKSDTKQADVFCFQYDVHPEGNVHVYKDPHGELTKQNVLIERGTVEQTAEHFGLTVKQTKDLLSDARQCLWTKRQQRPRPHLDNKIITAWNGMMITAFAKASQVLDDADYLRRAVDAIKFIRSRLFVNGDESETATSGVTGCYLLRSCYVDGETKEVTCTPAIRGFADDYVFMVRAALDVYEASHDESWLEWATVLQKRQDDLFWDNESAGYYTTTAEAASVILRLKEDQDGAEPSYNSVSAHNLLRLHSIMDSANYKQRAEAIFVAFARRLETMPLAVPELVTALMHYNASSLQICVCGSPSSETVRAMLRCIHSHYRPRKTLLLLTPEAHDVGFLQSRRRSLESFAMVAELPAAYVCDDFVCSLPATSVDELNKLLLYKDQK